MYRGPAGRLQRYKVLDIETTIEAYESGTDTSLGKTTYNTLREALSDITKILGEEIYSTADVVSEETTQNSTTSDDTE